MAIPSDKGEQKGGVQTRAEQRVQVLEGDPVKLFRFICEFNWGTDQKRKDKPWGEEGNKDFRV